ncbi:Hypothetical protein NTJ_05784 [Nesidiocoris tenuis]|uniref:Spaetzle domain-containing protein n=1 Tax=Nesidiocoris tenuis TaxID=355587 RepID=A0ABN7AL76_9HEMI|nr:Hypothetical protein NTJ_05784 [Nesidiocoris tenuis]
MNFTKYFALLIFVIVNVGSAIGDDLDDISFDDDEPGVQGLDDVSENGEAGKFGSSYAETEEQRRTMLKKVLNEALRRPGAKSRLGQVLPIVRLMTPPQKLALASLVMAQVLAGPNDPPPPVADSKNMTSQLMLPISMDIATMFRGMGKEQSSAAPSDADKNEGRSNNIAAMAGIYAPQRVALGPNIRRPPPTLTGISRRNANIQNENPLPRRRPWPGPKTAPKVTTTTKKPPTLNSSCTIMTNNLCVELSDYPEEEILSSLRKEINKEIVKALTNEPSQLKEADHKPKYLERRQGDSGEQAKRQMCTATLEYARPKKARATSGQWKYIVNTGDYTQTLRLELCSNPQSQCLYLADDVDSTCEQVFNYHRLLTWDETAGLTMDVFKVPTCCSCKVLGYGGLPFPSSNPNHPGSIEHPDTNLVGNDEAPVVRIPAPPPPLPPTTTSINKGHGVRVRPYAPPKRRPAVQHRGPPLPIEGETHPNEDSRYPPYDNNLRRITRNNTVDSRVKYTTHLLMPPSPNNRHPALPIDTLHADSVPTVTILPNPTTGHGHTTRPTHDHGHGHDNGHGHDHGISTGPPNYTVSTGPPHHSVATGPPSHGIATGPPSHGPSASTPNRRVNYSYHPIIDYFRPQIPQMAENRMGVDWTPIVERRRGKSADESSEEPEKLETEAE